MAYGLLVQTATAASNIDSYNRNCKSASDIENGSVFQLASRSSTAGEGELWVATAPATGALSHLWMAAEPEVVVTVSGNSQYKGLDPDVRNFKNIAGTPFAAIKLTIGDVVQLSSDAVEGTKGSNNYVVATDAKLKLQWASAAVSGVSLKLLGQKDIAIGSGTLGATQRQTAYLFEVVAVA